MSKQDKALKKNRKKITKNDLPVLDSDQDLFSAFMDSPSSTCPEEQKKSSGQTNSRLNKHGLPVIEEFEGKFLAGDLGDLSDQVPKESMESQDLEENFEILLEASLKQKKNPGKKKPIPMPIKKRLKRYPPPEVELDLHGFTALGAELKAKSFILTCKHQGYFSLRLIVGKGLHSDIGPVLPDVIEDLLKILEKQNLVLAYKWDRRKKSESGAVIVYLKQFND
ncbi:MAG: Smr/MutS family protein [Desulfobacteraceae bacterium]|nr:Smr/MutS family protein [Desulfobacteraceae bacterium]